ncbi:hypothetical protein ACFUNF_04390 [Streptomyces sp. NPDC057291]|uniref:hypothetical protein n=1 Tax=Streptomyces sp. NPDC057291 TaxID=3346087 RepID=UPI00363B1B6E
MATSQRVREARQYGAARAWAFLGLVLLGITAFVGLRAAVELGLLGDGGHIAASSCVEKYGGKGGP